MTKLSENKLSETKKEKKIMEHNFKKKQNISTVNSNDCTFEEPLKKV